MFLATTVTHELTHFRSPRPNHNSRTQMAKEKSLSELEVIKQAYPNIEDDFQLMFYSGVSSKRKRPDNAKDRVTAFFLPCPVFFLDFVFYRSVSPYTDGKECGWQSMLYNNPKDCTLMDFPFFHCQL